MDRVKSRSGTRLFQGAPEDGGCTPVAQDGIDLRAF